MGLAITGSIVLYKSVRDDVDKTIRCFLDTDLDVRLVLVDNSSGEELSVLKDICPERIDYIHSGKNLGFGAGHNLAVRSLRETAPYHLILNPDITFEAGTLERLYGFMQEHHDVGCVIPRVYYPDGSPQYVCRLLPSPLDFAVRWLSSVVRIFCRYEAKRNELYELRCSGYSKQMSVPFISGCFMFMRTRAFVEAGMFDERYFLYVEDVDLSRRVHQRYRTIFYPDAKAVHVCGRAAHRSFTAFCHFVRSAIKYFNKWGWFCDRERRLVNNRVLSEIGRG